MIAKTLSVALTGINGTVVEVETDMKQGLPGIQIVGMGSKAVNEARERIRSALTHSSLPLPPRKFTVNLAPAELPKDGALFDLALAVSLLVATGQLQAHQVERSVFAGELSLNGDLKPIRGALAVLDAAKQATASAVYLPVAHEAQATLIPSLTVYAVPTLKALFLHLKGIRPLEPVRPSKPVVHRSADLVTLDDIRGQDQAKRALEIAVAGRHPILLYGPPGTGKTMLAQAIPGLLPHLSEVEQIEVTKLHSVKGEVIESVITTPPFRSPHHTISSSALIGGGNKGRPGELSLAHCGVLYLDELPEFQRATLEALRQPLERQTITINRLYSAISYPCSVMLVASMNPCPCGYYADPVISCRCTEQQIRSYQHKLSGPFLDRIHLFIPVSRVDVNETMRTNSLNNMQQPQVLKHIRNASKHQRDRFKRSDKYNAHLSSRDVQTLLTIDPAAQKLLIAAAPKLALSTRAYFTTIKIAQTIADLAGAKSISAEHVSEALQLRSPFPNV